MFLNRYKPKQKTPHDAVTIELFSKGRDFEASFKDQFPNGIDISLKLGKMIQKYPGHTETLLENNHSITLFEAGLIHDDVLILTDVLHKNQDTYQIFEIKLSRTLNDTIKWDMALQYYVAKSVLKNIESFNAVLRDENDRFNVINLTEELAQKQDEVQSHIQQFKRVLGSKSEPQIPMGHQCNKPYPCEFKAYCQQNSGLFG